MSTQSSVELAALLGSGTSFKGTLHFRGRVRIDGHFEGDVHCDGTLIIGDGAEVTANIEVEQLIVRGGTLRGTAKASRSIELYVPANVTADLEAPEVFMDRGVAFEGSCKVTRPEATHTTDDADAQAPEPRREP